MLDYTSKKLLDKLVNNCDLLTQGIKSPVNKILVSFNDFVTPVYTVLISVS